MVASERREKIMSILQQTNFIKITDIVTKFSVSNETARRDLDYLQEQKLIRRIYGGAILAKKRPISGHSPSYINAELRAIGRAAADMISPGETVFICNGSTMLELAKNLKNRSDITILTNSLQIINELADSSLSIFVLGGLLGHGELDMTGELTTNAINHFYCDKAFFSCGGVTTELGVMDYTASGMLVQSSVIKRSSQHILVAGSHKFGNSAFIVSCSLDDVDTVISDTQLSPEYQNYFHERNTDLILVEPSQEPQDAQDE